MSSGKPVVGVDVGGTFTDCVAWVPGGQVRVAKVATTADESEAVLAGTARLTDGDRADALFHGTTVATNTLLERRGADTVLLTDPGFEDVIEIGRQDRPSLYDSFADRPLPLVTRDDRLGETDPEAVAQWVARRRPESVAISLTYSFADPQAEERLAAALDGIPVSVSHRVAPEFREFERTSTTVLNAYLQPRLGRYLESLTEQAESVADHLQIMRSSGGLMQADDAARLAAALLLSGPAGGVVAAAALGDAHGYRRLVTFDMGGTSTDVCRIEDGRPEVAYERAIEGYVCRMPSVAVHTVGAGGGSLAWKDPGGSLRVGPRSAGAHPGPAAYGLGGIEPTVTDAHVVLGRIDPAGRLGGSLPLDPAAARAVVERLGAGFGFDVARTAEGIVQVVEAHMERAIRNVSVEQGADPRAATLVAFGGAGGLHATSLARRLDMAAVAIPPYAGVFSALGLLMAPPRLDAARSVSPTGPYWPHLDELATDVAARFARANGRRPDRVERLVDMRYRGQSHEIGVPVTAGDTPGSLEAAFHLLHREINGFARPDDPVEVVTVRAVAAGEPLLTWADLPRLDDGPSPTPRRRPVTVAGDEVEAEVWWRPDLSAGAVLAGPAVVEEEVGTTFLLPGDRARVTPDGTLEVTFA